MKITDLAWELSVPRHKSWSLTKEMVQMPAQFHNLQRINQLLYNELNQHWATLVIVAMKLRGALC